MTPTPPDDMKPPTPITQRPQPKIGKRRSVKWRCPNCFGPIKEAHALLGAGWYGKYGFNCPACKQGIVASPEEMTKQVEALIAQKKADAAPKSVNIDDWLEAHGVNDPKAIRLAYMLLLANVEGTNFTASKAKMVGMLEDMGAPTDAADLLPPPDPDAGDGDRDPLQAEIARINDNLRAPLEGIGPICPFCKLAGSQCSTTASDPAARGGSVCCPDCAHKSPEDNAAPTLAAHVPTPATADPDALAILKLKMAAGEAVDLQLFAKAYNITDPATLEEIAHTFRELDLPEVEDSQSWIIRRMRAALQLTEENHGVDLSAFARTLAPAFARAVVVALNTMLDKGNTGLVRILNGSDASALLEILNGITAHTTGTIRVLWEPGGDTVRAIEYVTVDPGNRAGV